MSDSSTLVLVITNKVHKHLIDNLIQQYPTLATHMLSDCYCNPAAHDVMWLYVFERIELPKFSYALAALLDGFELATYFYAKKNHISAALCVRGTLKHKFDVKIDTNTWDIAYTPSIDLRRKKFMQWVQQSLKDELMADIANVFTAGMVECNLEGVMTVKEMKNKINAYVLKAAGEIVGYY